MQQEIVSNPQIYCPECGGRGWVRNIFDPCELCQGNEFVPASIGRGYNQETSTESEAQCQP